MEDIVSGIVVDYTRDNLFDELGIKRLKESYMKEGEHSPQERFAYVSKAFSSNAAHAQRLYNYSSKHWLSYSTPNNPPVLPATPRVCLVRCIQRNKQHPMACYTTRGRCV